jgi:hypothetical protein
MKKTKKARTLRVKLVNGKIISVKHPPYRWVFDPSGYLTISKDGKASIKGIPAHRIHSWVVSERVEH